MSNDEDSGLIDLVVEQLQTQGVSSANVKDGRMWLFKRSFLENLLKTHPDQEIFQILIKTREFENQEEKEEKEKLLLDGRDCP